MSTTRHLAAIRERANTATPGPWAVDHLPTVFGAVDPSLRNGDTVLLGSAFQRGDIKFIIHARTDVPRLLDAVEAVLKVHTPGLMGVTRGDVVWESEDPICVTCFKSHPCPTVQAITSALGATR